MYSGVSIKHLIPSEFVLQDPASVSKAIIKRDLLRIPAFNPGPYGIGANNHTTFRLSSPQDFIDFTNSYFEATLTSSAVGTAFDLGLIGIHSLFDRIEVRGLGNIQIQEQQNYPDWAALWQRLYRDHDYNYAEGIVDGRDVHVNAIIDAPNIRSKTISFDVNENVLAQVAADVDTLTAALAQKIDSAYATFGGALVFSQASSAQARINTTAKILHFRPRLSFFKMMFPLFLSKSGIEIKFYYSASPVLGTSAAAFGAIVAPVLRVTQFDMWANFVTPHPDVLAEYTEQWQSPQGLIYYLPSVRYQEMTNDTSTDTTMSLQFNVRSGRRLLQVCKPTTINYDDAAPAWSSDVALFPRTGIDKYQARVGAFQYPSERVDNVLRMYENLLLSNGGKLSMTAQDWYRTTSYQFVAGSVPVDDLFNFIMVHDFSRYSGVGSEMTGLDLSTVPIDIYIYRTAAWPLPLGKYRYASFLEYDAFLKLSSQQISRIE